MFLLTPRRLKSSALILAVAFLAFLCVYFLAFRPWHLTWGATDEEVSRTMRGDELIPAPSFNATRAVTINACPEEIWPWLLQMGYRKAGFYSYDSLDNDGIPSAEHIIPQYQDLKVGDRIPMSKDAYVHVISMEPNRSMVWRFQDGAWGNATWTWGLYETDARQTRLITRLRIKYDWTSRSIIGLLVVDAVELVMMRECLLGIKRRVKD